jgi:hypothetical protein
MKANAPNETKWRLNNMTNLYALSLASLPLFAALLMTIALLRRKGPPPADMDPAFCWPAVAARRADWRWARQRFSRSMIARREAGSARPRCVIVYAAGSEGLKRMSLEAGSGRPLYKIGVTKNVSPDLRVEALGAAGYASVTLTAAGPVAEAGFESWSAQRLGKPRQALGPAIRLLPHGILVRLPGGISPAQFEARLRVGLAKAFRGPKLSDGQGELFADWPARFTPKVAGHLTLACELVSFRPRSREDMTILVGLIQRLLASDAPAGASVRALREK